ncbi:MAG: VOC family protein, partial [Bacteroidota bacterium]
MINELEIILYVSDQAKSRDFYSAILGLQPVLDVPGMTEFEIHPGMKLGLMPESGIAKIIGANLPHPSGGNGIPRCELYLLVNDAEVHYDMALELGAKP